MAGYIYIICDAEESVFFRLRIELYYCRINRNIPANKLLS